MYDRLHLPVRLAPRHRDVASASASECSVAALPRRSMTMSSRFSSEHPAGIRDACLAHARGDACPRQAVSTACPPDVSVETPHHP